MKIQTSLFLALALLPLLVHGQGEDPTRPSAKLADHLRSEAIDTAALRLRALVVGAENNGIALLGTETPTQVRAGSRLTQPINGVRVELEIRAITAKGVELAMDTHSQPILLEGGYRALEMSTNPPPEFLRYVEATSVPLETLLRLISDQAGVNISASENAAQKTVSILLRNVTASTTVEELCRTSGLWYRREEGSSVIRVSTMQEYSDNLTSFREESTETFTLLYPNVLEVASVIYGLYPERTLLSLGEDELLEDDENDLSRRFRRFDLINESGGSQFLKMEAPDATGTGGRTGSGVFSYSRGGFQRIGQEFFRNRNFTPRGLTAAEAKKIESAFSKNDTNTYETVYGNAVSQQPNVFVTLSRRNNMLIVRTSDTKMMEEIRSLVRRLDVPTPMVLLEVKVLELDITDNYEASFQYSFSQDQTKLGGTKAQASGGFPGFDALNIKTPLTDAMSFQVIDRALDMRIQALQTDGKMRTLATPTLLTANGEVSRIFDGSEIPIIKGISSQTTVSETSTVSSPITEFEYQDVGTMLLITPNINADKTVTLRLIQENSERVVDGAKIPVYNAASSTPVAEANVDIVHSRSLSGTFIAKDGMAVAAGGLISETEKERYSRVPILGSIPLIGFLFRSTEKVKQRTELVVIIRPHVISTPVEGGRISQELLEAISAHPARDGRGSLLINKAKDGKDENIRHSVTNDVRSILR
ncbi:MAG: type II secretion system protein GspD [Kiritimatiellae bacterium]|nr:type II secretion system protein GspD [Kiritimatiellia bacterium]